MVNRRRVGSEYERKAGAYLETLGYRVLEYNYRNKAGEIDLIALDEKNMLVFCEVKYRSSGRWGDPSEAVDLRKQRRISMAALWYYMEHGIPLERGCRFDVIAITQGEEIRHYRNAFGFRG